MYRKTDRNGVFDISTMVQEIVSMSSVASWIQLRDRGGGKTEKAGTVSLLGRNFKEH